MMHKQAQQLVHVVIATIVFLCKDGRLQSWFILLSGSPCHVYICMQTGVRARVQMSVYRAGS